MEKRISTKVQEHIDNLKDNIFKIIKQECDKNTQIIIKNHLDNFTELELTKEDFTKRKRVKNIVPFYDRCLARRANGQQCSRRRKDEATFCGTHIKGQPHGVVTSESQEQTIKTKTISVKQQDIKGIIYYIDDNNNVYDPNDIINGKRNPNIIAKYEYDSCDERYSIPEFDI
tara:strand:- start:961 stop:1476 length:516 start_codon:yes stop_codon:yes gene_type:complete